MQFYTKVVGVSFRNDDGSERQRIIRDLDRKDMLNPGQELYLQREPTNPYDYNCIKVLGPDGRQIGNLSREIAAQLSPEMARGKRYTATVNAVTGGGVDMSYGVNIIISY